MTARRITLAMIARLEGTPMVATIQPTPPPSAPSRMHRRGFGRTANVLLTYTLAKGLQLSLYALIFPLYLYHLGYKQDTIGLVTALGAVTTLVGAVPLGLLADRVGRARLFVASALLTPFPYLTISFTSSLAVIIPAVMIANFLATIYWSTNAPLLVGAVGPEDRVRVFAANSFLLMGLGALGAVIGGTIPVVAGHLLHESSDATMPLRIALSGTAIISAIGAIPLLGIRAVDGVPEGRARAWRFRKSDLRLFGKLLCADALQAFGAGAIIGFLPLFFRLRYGLSAGVLGILFTTTGILSGVASLAAPVLARRLGDLRALITAQAVIAPAILFTALAPFVWLAIFFEVCRTALRGTVDPIYTPFAMTRVPARQRGALGGLYNVTWATGFSLGPLISGAIQVHAGFGPAFTMSAACYAVAAFTMFLFFRDSPAIADEQELPVAA
ncbi:MAG: MFS transporter [Thermomicrobiales bacterium]